MVGATLSTRQGGDYITHSRIASIHTCTHVYTMTKDYYYKQVWPLAALASLHALRPPSSARVSVCSLWTVLTCYARYCIALCKAPISFPPHLQQHGTAMAARIGAAKVQGFRKGYLVDSNL